MSAAPYRVAAAGPTGLRRSVECATFGVTLIVARKLHAEGQRVVVWNDEIADGGYGDDGTEWRDGLTEDEREQLVEAGVYA